MSAQAGLLAHNQPDTAKPSTFLPKEMLEFMVSRLAAEKLSQRLYRMFPPDSTFQVLNPYQVLPKGSPVMDFKLPPAEVGNCRFVPPLSNLDPQNTIVRLVRLSHAG